MTLQRHGSKRAIKPARLALMVVLLGVIWFAASHLGAGQQAAPQASAAATAYVTTTAPAGQPATAAPEQVAAQFLAAYFTWSNTDTQQVYVQRWSRLVVPASVTKLAATSPRQSLDSGNDRAAQSKAPLITADSLLVQQQSAQVAITWTIQVVPKGDTSWQPRAIQASVWLTQANTAWLVKDVIWSASAS